MQIILVQSEINEALKNYVMSQINIKDDMEVSIDLAATRGEDGFKATISIVPRGKQADAKQAVVAPAPAPHVEPTPPFDVTPPAPAPTQQPIQEDNAAVQAAAVNSFVTAAQTSPIPTPVVMAAEKAQPEAEEKPASVPVPAPAPSPAESVRTLFAGLHKPKNTA